MVDKNVILAKASAVRTHLKRAGEKCGRESAPFLKDRDCQDIVCFNLHVAIQNCIDIAAHIISEKGMGVPGSFNEMFYLLEANHYLSADLTEKMVRAIGFRNLLVHEYGKIDMQQVFEIVQHHGRDLNEYLMAVLSVLGISDK